MKALLKRDANIIEIPDDFARLTNITQDGFFIYKIKYRADPVKAIKARTFLTVISVSDKPLIRRSVRTFTNYNPADITRKLRTRSALTKDVLRQETSNKILTIRSDITKKIPNNRTINLGKSRFTNSPIIKTNLRVKPALVDDLNQQNLAMPILDRNTTRLPSLVQKNSLNETKGNFRKISARLINNGHKDPASFVGLRTNSISSADRAINGTISKRAPTVQTQVRIATPLVASLLNQKNYSNQSQLKTVAYFNIPLKEEATWIEIEETVKIPIGDLSTDEFFLTFELQNNHKIDVQTITKSVPHSENISKLQIPTIAPELMTFTVGSLGRTILNVKQLDENATKIKIYRRELNKSSATTDAQYDFVGEVEASKGEDYKKIDDLFASINPVVYRAIPVNGDDILGADFSSAVVEQKNHPYKKGRYRRQPYFVSLSEEIHDRSIAVTIRDIPPGPIAIKLLRRDLTINEQKFTTVLLPGDGGTTTLIESDSNTQIVIEDTNVKLNRIYEYRILFVFGDGLEEEGANNLIVEFSPVSANILELELGDPNIEQSGDDIDVTFSIQKNVIQTQGDLIKSFLSEQGLTTEFQDQLLANREQLQNLFGARVTRRNLTTGELEDFGIVSSNIFSDKKFGRVRSVQPLQSGFDYKYNVTAHARETETLFPTLAKIATPRTNVSYSFAPNKWKHPVTLNQGNLVTDRTLIRNHSKSTFTFGRVVDNKSVTISLADVLPSLYAGKAIKLGDEQVLVQWKIQGEVNKIDHFLIMLEILGMRTIVGKSHNITKSNYFQFADKLTNKESGELTYFIVPVFFDYGRGPELKTNSVIV